MYSFTHAAQSRARLLFIFVSNFLALSLLSFFSFNRNTGRLLTGLDGPTLASASEVQFTFFGITPHLHSNVLTGLGNTYISNLTLMPGIFDYFTGIYAPALFFTWFALQLFISVFLTGWNYGFNNRVNYFAAWLLTILFLPYFYNHGIYAVTETAPHIIELILAFVLFSIGIYRMGQKSWFNTLIYGAILLSGVVMILVLCPTALILMIPVLLLMLIHACLKVKNRTELFRKIGMGMVVLIIAIAAGWGHFVLGLLSNTSSKFFHADMTGAYQSLVYVSILFQGNTQVTAWGPWLFCFATLGMLLAIYKSASLRSLAITILIAQFLIVGLGIILMSLSKPWLGPAPIYCEVFLFPFYALFTIYLFSQFSGAISWTVANNKWFDLVLPFESQLSF